MFGARSCWCFHFIIHFKQLKFNQKKCKISLDGWQQSLMHCMLRILVWKACRCVYVSVCLCTVCPCPTYLSPLIFFPSLAGFPRGCDTHSSASSLIKASAPLSLLLRSQGAHQRRGEVGEGARKRGAKSEEGEWQGHCCKNPTGTSWATNFKNPMPPQL